MNKHSVITAVATVFIIIPFALSGFNILGAQQLEYRWDPPGEFSFFALSNGGQMEFCNPVPFWTSYQKFEILPFYGENQLGGYVVTSLDLAPGSSEIQHALFKSDRFSAAQQTFMAFDFQFDEGTKRLNPDQFIITVRTSTPILGLIPYSTETSVLGSEFDQSMNRKTLSCN